MRFAEHEVKVGDLVHFQCPALAQWDTVGIVSGMIIKEFSQVIFPGGFQKIYSNPDFWVCFQRVEVCLRVVDRLQVKALDSGQEMEILNSQIHPATFEIISIPEAVRRATLGQFELGERIYLNHNANFFGLVMGAFKGIVYVRKDDGGLAVAPLEECESISPPLCA